MGYTISLKYIFKSSFIIFFNWNFFSCSVFWSCFSLPIPPRFYSPPQLRVFSLLKNKHKRKTNKQSQETCILKHTNRNSNMHTDDQWDKYCPLRAVRDEKSIKGALSLFCIDHLLQGIGPSWSMVNIPSEIYFFPLQVDVSTDNVLDRCRNSHSSHPLTPLSAETQCTWTVSDFHTFCEFICTLYLLCLEMFPWSHSSFLVLTVFHLLLLTLRGGVW